MRTSCAALLTLGLVDNTQAAFAYSGTLASYDVMDLTTNSFFNSAAGDEKRLGVSVNYSYDLDAKTKWTREDNPTLWYVGAFGFKAEAFAEIELVLDVFVAQWRLILPFNFIDISPFEFYYLTSKENDLYCTGSFYYWNFFNVIPYYVENWMNCHMSIIGRILNVAGVDNVSFLNTRAFSFSKFSDIFECSSNANWSNVDGLVATDQI